MKKKLIITIILIIIALIITAVSLYFKTYSIDFEKEYEFVSSVQDVSEAYLIWYTLRDEKYGGFYSSDNLDEYGIDRSEFDFNFNEYTYVVTLGYQLKELNYSYSNMKNRKFLFVPKEFIGQVTVDSIRTDKIYIYKIKKMDVDCDYHNPHEYITFL